MILDELSIEHLHVFIAVVEHGSFSAAARALGRAQSAMSYAVQRLESQTGLLLFDRTAYRPSLTEAGRALLPRARGILEAAGAFRAQAESLGSGLEGELSLVVEAMFPMSRLVAALREFQQNFPTVQTHLHVESLGAARDAVLESRADIGLIIHTEGDADRLHMAPAAEIELVAVAAPDHPLAAHAGALTAEDLRPHLQLVFSDRTTRGRWPDRGVMAAQTWRLGDLGAKHAMLLAGLGWGSMPLHIVADDLAACRLVRLVPASWDGSGRLPRLPIIAVHRRDRVLGAAGRWLYEKVTRTGGA